MARPFRHIWKRLVGDEAGSVFVEMTLLTPLMLVLAAGVFEFSNIIQTKLLIEAGVRDAALYIARCGRAATACEADAKAIAVDGATGTARVSDWTIGQIEVSYQNIAITIDPDTGLQNYRSGNASVTTVTVSSDYSYSGTGLWAYLGFGALTLTATHEERVLGS